VSGRAGVRGLWLLAWLTAVPAMASGGSFFDDFEGPLAWTGPVYQYGNPATGDAFARRGILTVRHAPVGKRHSVSVERTCEMRVGPGTWFHFRFRARRMLLGADMYTTVSVGGQTLIQFGVNGEQHWVQGAACQAKRLDDELFWGSPLIVGEAGGKNTDMRVGVAEALRGRLRYTDWVLFSAKLEGAGPRARLRLFANGYEIVYRDLDAAYPAGGIDNHLRPGVALPGGQVPVTLTLANFTDGDLYGDTRVNDGAGVRWEHAFADQTPALPHPTDPAKALKRDADFLWDWVLAVNEAEMDQVAGPVRRLVDEGRLPAQVARRVRLGGP
jgi:hypothetical protein